MNYGFNMGGGRPRTDPEARFWPRVEQRGPDDCWLWTGTTDPYGRFWIGKRQIGAHRFSLELHLGRPLAPGMWALHTCDNPPCVNPAHLYEGDRRQNVADMVERGQWRGNFPNQRRLTWIRGLPPDALDYWYQPKEQT